MKNNNHNLLTIQNLKTTFSVNGYMIKAVDGVDLNVKKGETLGIIGETGCGKSILALSVLRLLPKNSETRGKVIYNGKNLLDISHKEMRTIRGKEIALIPQNSGTSLNPIIRIGCQIAEVLTNNFGSKISQAKDSVLKQMKKFDIDPAEERAKEYPHQFSGGMRQKVLVSIGIIGSPALILADEPTKGIDSTGKDKILKAFRIIKSEYKDTSMILISHDIPFIKEIVDRVAVMYCGEIMEISSTEDFFTNCYHPYSKGMLKALPINGLVPLEGESPSMISPPGGCKFHPRCQKSKEICKNKSPRVINIGKNSVRCWLYD